MLQNAFRRQLRWKSWIYPWHNLDWVLLVAVVLLTGLGVMAIRSTELNKDFSDWIQQLATAVLGLGIALGLARWRYTQLLVLHWWIYLAINLLLIAVIAIGTSANGAQSWITIGSFNIQPSEFAKMGLIISLAALLHQRSADSIPAVLQTLAVTIVPWGLIFIQPDLGTSLVFGAITLGMLYWANANPGWIILIISPLVSAIAFSLPLPFNLSLLIWGLWTVGMGIIGWQSLYGPLGAFMGVVVNLVSAGLGQLLWGLLKEYQKDRLTLFLDPDKDPLGGGYHLIQSRIAIGAGGLWGKGLSHGTQTQLGFIPEQHTDFIFSAIGEELGFVGAMLVLLLFWMICWRLIAIANSAQDNFGSLLAIGVFSMIVFQVFINIGMTIGLTPVTGIPLPWLSYGRSALITNFVALGLVESVANFRPRKKY
ncbi:MAG: rod shape-determining protein RodA [Aphanocapsa sp. GSE-SYN-MK-11-07L]|jgi:rod shape determining protein RodA|nr:rod shape-determining protein RodA [Aphanocapsa sp. GSE-SYN-MK-11-07L]